MKNYELIENATYADYLNLEAELVADITEQLIDAEVQNKVFGTGVITEVRGDTFENTMVTVVYPEVVKKYFLKVAAMQLRSIIFTNESIFETCKEFYDVHKELATRAATLKAAEYQQTRDAIKKHEADVKAEEKYQRMKTKAINDFETLVNTTEKFANTTDEFFFTLGWLAKNLKTITATLPDYLETPFKNHFGSETPCTVVDSRKKTSGGNAMKWTWSFKATFGKVENVPEFLSTYVDKTGKSINNTAFIWQLVDNYGFKFGKEQDVEAILKNVPETSVPFFKHAYYA